MSDFTRCLITGATGFVGSHLARRLVAEGKDVHILIRATSSLAAIQDIAGHLTIHRMGSANASAKVYATNAATAPATACVTEAITKANPDVVFHLAAMFRAEHAPEDIAPMIEANVTFTTQLLEGMMQTGAKTLINTGTSWQHYPQHYQKASYDPVCLYAATKQAAEDIITFYCNAHGFRAIKLKLFDTYGPGDTRNKLLNIFKRACESETPIAFSAGEQLIDLVHIDDVINAYQVAAQQAWQLGNATHEKYGVNSDDPLLLRDLAERYEAITSKRLNIAWGGRPYRAREVMQTPTLPRPPGWAPVITFDAGLSELINPSSPIRDSETMRSASKVAND